MLIVTELLCILSKSLQKGNEFRTPPPKVVIRNPSGINHDDFIRLHTKRTIYFLMRAENISALSAAKATSFLMIIVLASAGTKAQRMNGL